MNRTSEELALLAAVRAHPEEDTPRLVWADWLDEHDEPERAELIRVQIELTKYPGTDNVHTPVHKSGHAGCWHCTLVGRVCRLVLDNDRGWRAGPKCDRLHGRGFMIHTKCSVCFGTGDGGGLSSMTAPHTFRYRVEYVRGTKRVYCNPSDVWQAVTNDRDEPGDRDLKFEPADWARAVCLHHPDVTELWVENRLPYRWIPSAATTVDWIDGFVWHPRSREVGGVMRIPDELYDLVPEVYPTSEAAVTALARANVTWVHNHLDDEKGKRR